MSKQGNLQMALNIIQIYSNILKYIQTYTNGTTVPLTLHNSIDPDKISHYEASHHGHAVL